MGRARLASVLAVAWAAIQAWSLLLLRFYPPQHIVGWSLCVAFLLVAIGLWLARPWARVLLLVLGVGFIVFYAAGFFVTGLPCAGDGSNCNIPLVLSQPLVTVAALVALLKPLASNPTMERDARKSGARPSL